MIFLQIIKKIELDFYDNEKITINAKQYDVLSRYIQIVCCNKGKKINIDKNSHTAFFRVKKPDENIVLNNCTINDSGELIVELTDQVLATKGLCLADIVIVNKVNASPPVITDDGKLQFDGSSSIISTMNFYINVISTPYEYALLESLSEFDALENLLDQVYQNYSELSTLLPSVQESAQIAQEAAQKAQEAALSVDLSSLIQSSTTEPIEQPINGLWLKEIK